MLMAARSPEQETDMACHVAPNRRTHLLEALVCAVLLVSLQAAGQSRSCSDVKQTSSQLLVQAEASFADRRDDRAAALWIEIHDCAPGTPDWWKAVFNLGQLAYDRGDNVRAILLFEELLRSHPDDKEPGGNIMETNRNYSFRSAWMISRSYENIGQYGPALRYAWLAKTRYRYYSWCGTCLNSANLALSRRIAYLMMRASRAPLWIGVLCLGLMIRRAKRRDTKAAKA